VAEGLKHLNEFKDALDMVKLSPFGLYPAKGSRGILAEKLTTVKGMT